MCFDNDKLGVCGFKLDKDKSNGKTGTKLHENKEKVYGISFLLDFLYIHLINFSREIFIVGGKQDQRNNK